MAIKQAHIRISPADRERIDSLARWWRIKSDNATIIEAIRVAYNQEVSLRRAEREAAKEVRHS